MSLLKLWLRTKFAESFKWLCWNETLNTFSVVNIQDCELPSARNVQIFAFSYKTFQPKITKWSILHVKHSLKMIILVFCNSVCLNAICIDLIPTLVLESFKAKLISFLACILQDQRWRGDETAGTRRYMALSTHRGLFGSRVDLESFCFNDSRFLTGTVIFFSFLGHFRVFFPP